MAELPRVPFPDSTTRPIRYNLSQADIAGPYTAIARSAEKVSGALEDVAKPLAEEAGRQAVRRDDSGNLIVDRLPPIIGEAAVSARLATAAKLQPQIETDLLKQKLDNQYDPIGFQKSVGAYKPALLKGMDPALARGVDRMVDNTSQQYLRSIMVEKDAHDTQEFKENTEAQLTRINDQTQVLARQQGGVESKEYSQLYQERLTLINALANNPRLKIPPEKRQLMLQQAHGNDMGQSIVGQTIRMYQTKANKTEAQRFLMDWAWGEQGKDLPLTPAQRDHFVNEGLKSLEGMSAEDRKAITANNAAINGAVKNWMDTPALARDAPYNDLETAAKAINNTEGLRVLHAWQDFRPVFEDLSSQNAENRARKVAMIQRLVEGYRPGASPDEAFTNAPGPEVRVDMTDAATAHMWDQAVAKARARAAQDAEAAHKDLKYALDNKHQVTPEQVAEFGQLAGLARRNDLVEDLRPGLAAAVARGNITSAQSNAVVSAVRQVAATSTDPVAQRTADLIVKQTEEDVASERKAPLQYATDKFGASPVGPLNPSNPDAFAGELFGRNATAATFHEREPTFGAASYIGEAEAAELYPQLTHGLDPASAAKALGAFRVIPEGDRVATMTQPRMKDAIRDMGYSLDPLRVEASMQQQEWLWRTDHRAYMNAYGEDGERHLQSWQGLQAFTPEERTAYLNKPVTGQDLTTRKALEDKTKADMSSWKPSDVTAAMAGTSFLMPNALAQALGSQPAPPMDDATGQTFRDEFVNTTAILRGSGMPQAQAQQLAAQKMNKVWQPSALNGGALMKYPPEITYGPPLPGDPGSQWQQQQAHDLVTSIRGPQQTLVAGEQSVTNWTIKGVVSDAQTGNEYIWGLPASYRIVVADGDGKIDFLHDETGNMRFRFDPREMPEEPFTNAKAGLTSPAGQAYERRRQELVNAQTDLAKRREMQQRLYGVGGGEALRGLGTRATPVWRYGIPNLVRRMTGAPPLEGDIMGPPSPGPPLDHGLHSEWRDAGP